MDFRAVPPPKTMSNSMLVELAATAGSPLASPSAVMALGGAESVSPARAQPCEMVCVGTWFALPGQLEQIRGAVSKSLLVGAGVVGGFREERGVQHRGAG